MIFIMEQVLLSVHQGWECCAAMGGAITLLSSLIQAHPIVMMLPFSSPVCV